MKQDDCNICGKAKGNPYRAYDQMGNIVQGCVSSYHDNALVPLSNTSDWHNRKEAKAISKSLKKHALSA